MRNLLSTKISEFRNFFLSKISHIKINKKLAAVTAVIIFLVAALVASLIYLGVREDNKAASSVSSASEQAIVYKKADGVYLTAKNITTKLEIRDEYKLEITDDGKYLIYTTASQTTSKKYDLYICSLTKRSKVKDGAVLTDYGVERDFKYNNGILYYSKQDKNSDGINTFYYNISKKKSKMIDFNIEDLYVPSSGDLVYYTKNLSGVRAIYSFSPEGEKGVVREIANPIKAVHFYDDGKNSELIYETGKADSETSELVKLTPGKNSVNLATQVSKVLYDDYEVGGNLYYFVKQDVPTDWRGIIEDDAAGADAAMKKPDKSEYKYIFGISPQYFLDSDAYKAKELRDEIREYLDKTVKKDFFKESYTLYVKQGEKPCKMAEGVSPDTVYSTAPTGTPRVIYMAKQVKNSGKQISDFTRNISKRSFSVIKPEIDEILKECVVDTGLTYAYAPNLSKSDNGKSEVSKSVTLKGYAEDSTTFIFGKNENELYTMVKDASNESYALYRQNLSNGKLMPAEKIALETKQAKVIDDVLWYVKTDTDSVNGSLCKYTDGVTEILDTNVYSFNAHSNEDILVYKNFSSSNGEQTVDISYCDGTSMADISSNADVDTIKFKEDGITFLRATNENGGELCCYSKGKLQSIDKNVHSIIAY